MAGVNQDSKNRVVLQGIVITKIELCWAITGMLSNGTGQRCMRLLDAMLSLSSSGTQQDKKRERSESLGLFSAMFRLCIGFLQQAFKGFSPNRTNKGVN